MLFSATWRQKSQKIDFMNVFHGFIGFGRETANIFNTCRAPGENNPPIYCQYLQGMLAIYNINSCRDQNVGTQECSLVPMHLVGVSPPILFRSGVPS